MRLLLVEEDPKVRSLLRHHLSCRWPDVQMTAHPPLQRGPLAPEFLAAADRHRLDWRLLPSISVIESGGGKNYTQNNIFGWGSATRGFASIRKSIDWVAARLANSKLYKGKDLDGILATYNPRPGYRARVKSVMRMLGPDPPPAPRDALSARVNLRSGPQKQALPAPAP